MSKSESNSLLEHRPASPEPFGLKDAVYTLHPFADEWLWDGEDNSKPLTVSWSKAAQVAHGHRAECLRQADDDDGLRKLAEGMWFTVVEFDPEEDPAPLPDHLAALIGPDGTLYSFEDPRCLFLYEGIGSDGEWPTPYPDDVVLLCADCGEPMVCQNASHIRKIGFRNPVTGDLEERDPTPEEREEHQPRQGQISHGSCGLRAYRGLVRAR